MSERSQPQITRGGEVVDLAMSFSSEGHGRVPQDEHVEDRLKGAAASMGPILVVDDREENRYSFRKLLEQAAYPVVEAGSGMEALQYLLNHDVSLILIDVQMPEMDGFETVQAIRQKPRHHEVPIIFITAVHRSDDFADYGFSVGAHDYLNKPVDSRMLINKVKLFHTLYLQQKALEQSNADLKASEYARRRAEAREQYTAYCSGLAEMSNQVLHHVGNALSVLEGANIEIKQATHGLIKIQQLFREVATEFDQESVEEMQEELAEINAKLLSSIQQLPELLQSHWLEPMEHPVRNIEESIRHITDAIQIQRKGSERPKQVYTRFSLQELLEDMEWFNRSQIELLQAVVQPQVAPSLQHVHLPRNQLLEVLSILLRNSLEAIAEETEKGALQLGEGVVEIECQRIGEMLKIELIDNGCGFPSEQARQLFEFGYSTRKDQAGSGLHVAGNIVAGFKGSLKIESEGVSNGARATLQIPLQEMTHH